MQLYLCTFWNSQIFQSWSEYVFDIPDSTDFQKQEFYLFIVLSTNQSIIRLLTSVYEALTINQQLECEEKGKDYLPLWFLYSISTMNTLLVCYRQ